MTGISRPKYLTAKEWRANKGLFTKTVSDATGMGKALDKLDKEWNEVKWNEVDADQATAGLTVRGFDSTYTVANVNKAKEVAHQHAAKVEAVKEQLQAVEALARRTETTWKANKLVPSSAIKYVGQVKSAAQTLLEQLGKLDNAWKTRLQAAEVSEKLILQKLNSQIESRIVLLRTAAQEMQNSPSRQAFTAMYESFTELIPLLSMSSDRAHQALHRRLEQLKANERLDRPVTDKTLKTEEVANKARHLEEAVRGM